MRNSTFITVNVSIADVADILETNSTDVGTLCRHNNINKWSYYKPTRYSGLVTSSDKISASQCSLSPVTVSTNNVRIYGASGNGVSASGTAAPTGFAEWTYNRPSTPYRLLDFLNYNHASVPCDDNYAENPTINVYDWKIQCGNNDNYEGSGTRWKPKNVASSDLQKQTFSYVAMRLGFNSNDVIGSIGDSIPMAKLLNPNDDWRVGLIIEYNNIYYMCVGSFCIDEGVTAGQILPSLGTNSELVRKLKATTADKTITCYPCLVSKAMRSVNTSDGVNFDNCITSWNKIYCMPSGKGAFTVKVKNSEDAPIEPSIPMPSGWTKLNTLSSGVQVARKLIASGNEYSVYDVAIFFLNPITTDQSFSGVIYKKDGSSSSETYLIPSGSTLDTTYYGGYIKRGVNIQSWKSTVDKWTINGIEIDF